MLLCRFVTVVRSVYLRRRRCTDKESLVECTVQSASSCGISQDAMVNFFDYFVDYGEVVSGLSKCISPLLMHPPIYDMVPHDVRSECQALEDSSAVAASRRFVKYMEMIGNPELHKGVADYMLGPAKLKHLVATQYAVSVDALAAELAVQASIEEPVKSPTRSESLPVVGPARPPLPTTASEPVEASQVSPPTSRLHRSKTAPASLPDAPSPTQITSLHIVKRDVNKYALETPDGQVLYKIETEKWKGSKAITRIVRASPPPEREDRLW